MRSAADIRRGRSTPLVLPGTRADDGSFRTCGQCNESTSPNGGVDVSPTRWICSVCWKGRVFRKTLVDHNKARAR